MSTTVDSRVVEMRFDNKHFERNVSTTMSTLDKLKAKLGFTGATKGLENVSAAAKKVDLSSVGKSADTVGLRFNAMYTIADQALRNITNSAMQAGKNIVSALTIDPVKTGLSEYETKINAIQVIKANTRTKYDNEADQMADIEKALSDLNDYADRTIYNYTQMTNNVGKFVAQGLGVEEASKAVQGMANLAGASGASAEDMARATYQMSQALGGTIRKIDWNSLRNANMATVELKNTLMDLARVEGVDIDGMIAEKGTFEDTLEKGWLTGKMFTEAMNIYSDVYSEAELKAKGFSDEQVKNFKALAKTASEATTQVKTFSQLWDVLKETAQSGWTQSWELIIGDFEEAKALLTPLSNALTGFVNKMSDARNRVLQIALDFTAPWTEMMKKLGKIKDTFDKVKGSIEGVQEIVDNVWLGKFSVRGGDPDRKAMLEELGYNYEFIQELVNLGEASWHSNERYVLSEEEIAAAAKKHGVILEDAKEAADALTESKGRLTDEQLRGLKFTEDEIRLYRALEKEADRLGISMEELATEMSETDGRQLLIDSFKNIGDVFVGAAKAAKEAWIEICNPPNLEEIGVRLYGVLRAVKNFTESLRMTDPETGKLNANGQKLLRTFKGIFAIVDIVATLIGGTLRIAFKIVAEILKYFDLNILDVTATIGDALVAFHTWLESLINFEGILDKVVPLVKQAADAVSDWFARFKESEGVQAAIQYIKDLWTGIKDWWGGLASAEDLPKTIAEGIVNAFTSIPSIIKTIFSHIKSAFTGSFEGFGDSPLGGFIDKIRAGLSVAGQTIVELGKILLEKLNGFLTAHGFEAISEDAIAGLVNGLKDGASKAWEAAVQMAKDLVAKVKEFLGIHSPSTVFAAIGGFIIAGLIAGLQNGIPDSFGAVKDIFQPMIDWLQGIDWGALFASGMGVGILVVMNKFANSFAVFEGLGDMLEGIGVGIKNLGKGFKNLGKAANNWAMSKLITSIAIAIGVLAASVFLLSTVDPGRLWGAIGAIVVLVGVLGGLIAALQMFSSKLDLKSAADFGKMSVMLITIAGALLVVAIALRVLDGIESTDKVLVSLIGIMVLFAAVMKSINFVGKDVGMVGGTLFKIAAAMLVLALVAKIIAGMSWEEMGKAAVGLLGLTAFIVGLMAAMKLLGADYKSAASIAKIGPTLLNIAAAMLLLTIVAKIIAGMSWEEMGKAAVGLVFLGGIVTGLIAATKLAGGNIGQVGGTIAAIGAAMLILVIVAKIIAGMEWGELGKAAVGLLALTGIIAILVAIVKGVEKDAPKIVGTLLAMSVAIGIMGLTVALLGMLSVEHLTKGLVAVGILGAILALMVHATKGANDCKGNIIAMTVAIGIMVAGVAVLSLIDTGKLAGAVVALSVVMGMFALMIRSAKDVKGSLGTLIVMTVAIGMLAGMVYLLAQLPIESVLASAAALSTLLLSVSASLFILNMIGSTAMNALMGVLALLAMAVPMLAFVGILALMQNVQNATTNAMLLTAMMTAMTLLLIPLTVIGALGMAGLPYMGVLALLAMAVPMLAFVGILALMQNIQNAEANVNLLITLMSALTRMMVILAIVGPLALIGVAAVGALTGLILAVGGLAVVIGALMETFPALETFLDTGLSTLIKLAEGIGTMVGTLINSFLDSLTEGLPEIALRLSEFMTNLQPFIMGAKMLDESILVGIGALAGAILLLTAADLIAGVASFIQGGSSLAQLGTELSAFMMNAMPFIMGASLLNEEMMNGVKALAETVLILTGTSLLEGLASWLTGESSLTAFGAQLPELGSYLSQFATNLGTFDDSTVATVTCAANAIKAIAEAASELPNEGGWVGAILGENSLATFAAELPALGTHLSTFASNLGTFDESTVSTVTCAADAIKGIAEAAGELPNDGGWAGKIFGENSLATFAENLPTVGTNLGLFAANLGTFDEATVATVTCAANAIKAMSEAASGIDGQAEWAKKLFGDNSLGGFATELESVGSSLSAFVVNLGTFTDAQVSTVNAAVRAIKALSGLADADLKGAKKHLADFSDDLPGFAIDIADFCTNMPSADSINYAVTGLDKLLGAVDSIANANSGALATFADNLKKIGEDAVKKFVGAFTSDSAKTDLENAAKKLGDKVVDGIEAKEKAIKSAGKDAAKEAVDGLETQEDEAKTAGKNLGKGFVKGIEAKEDAAYDAGYALGAAAAQGINDGQESASPSKLAIQSGKWLGEGYIIGIGKMGSQVDKAGTNLGDTATKSLSSSISRISDMVSNDIDTQPTIRPVLDLTDVESGAHALNGMLNMGSSIGVRANLGAITSMMSGRGQNGSNADVVSAIDKLNKKMDNIGNTTYQINGITYDDGSNINDAVATLVRAARIERRV